MAAMSPVDRVRRVLAETPGVKLAVLFGSTARRRAGRGSDLDVGVSFAHGEGPVPPSLAVALERAAGCPVDLVSLDDAPPLLRLEIARDGIVLVERVNHAWSDFRVKAMLDWWDWAPTARMMHAVMAERIKEEAARGPA